MRIAIAGLSLLLLAAAPASRVDELGWLAGQWASETDGRPAEGSWTEESWSNPRGGAMIGHSRSGRGEQLREFEFLRLQPDEDGTPVYLAQPGGLPPVAFRLVQHDGTSATFENAAHDYPQRIHYVRSGDTLTATISAIDGSKPTSWVYKRR